VYSVFVGTGGSAVDQVGPGVPERWLGKRVWLYNGQRNGRWQGTAAEYIALSADLVTELPDHVSFAEGATLGVPGMTAHRCVFVAGPIQGKTLLVTGGAGAVGHYAVQLATWAGARVIATVSSAEKAERARAGGAAHIIDYRREDFVAGGRQYDLILAANAYRPIRDYVKALKANGIYVMTGGGGRQVLQAMTAGPLLSMTSGRKIGNLMAVSKGPDIRFLKELLEAGKIVPVIDRTYPLAGVPDAIRYMEQEHARGKLIITVSG